jgi:hypothetical protein
MDSGFRENDASPIYLSNSMEKRDSIGLATGAV